jgi:hypothetical protein
MRRIIRLTLAKLADGQRGLPLVGKLCAAFAICDAGAERPSKSEKDSLPIRSVAERKPGTGDVPSDIRGTRFAADAYDLGL